jgi:hypothetical protein
MKPPVGRLLKRLCTAHFVCTIPIGACCVSRRSRSHRPLPPTGGRRPHHPPCIVEASSLMKNAVAVGPRAGPGAPLGLGLAGRTAPQARCHPCPSRGPPSWRRWLPSRPRKRGVAVSPARKELSGSAGEDCFSAGSSGKRGEAELNRVSRRKDTAAASTSRWMRPRLCRKRQRQGRRRPEA